MDTMLNHVYRKTIRCFEFVSFSYFLQPDKQMRVYEHAVKKDGKKLIYVL